MKLLLLTLGAFLTAAAAAPGIQLGFSSGRIVGGQNAQQNQFPFVVSVQWRSTAGAIPQHVCGGTIVNELYVLTAAHCVTDMPAFGIIDVVAGKHDLSLNEATEQRRDIVVRILHPDYVGGVAPHDIALFRLSQPLQFNEAVRPINLPAASTSDPGTARLAGWGSTSETSVPTRPNILQTVEKPILPQSDCSTILATTPFHSNNLCTGPITGGISACSGDSGGPLFTYVGGEAQIVGVVSWGFVPCGRPGLPSVYVRVAAYASWIQINISVN